MKPSAHRSSARRSGAHFSATGFAPRSSFASLRALLAGVLAAAAAACGDDDPVTPPDPVATTVEVSPSTAELSALGATVQLSATVRDENGNVMAGAAVAWASSPAEVATVDANGLVAAVGNGQATVTATSGAASGSAIVTVAQAPSTVAVTPASVEFTAIGETAQLTAEVQDPNGNAIADAPVSWVSEDESVATVDESGLVTAVADGATTVAAISGGADGEAAVTVTTTPAPAAGPPAPEHAAGDVTSLFSDAYDDATVDTWSADWDQADVEDVDIAGDAAKKYTNLAFAGIEFTSAPIDASGMTHFRMDIWTPDATDEGQAFRVKLVDFGADGAFGGGDDSEHEVAVTAAEGLASEAWVHLDLALADFSALAARGNLAQLIISGDPNTVYVGQRLLPRRCGPAAARRARRARADARARGGRRDLALQRRLRRRGGRHLVGRLGPGQRRGR